MKKNYINVTIWADDGCKFQIRGPMDPDVLFAASQVLNWGDAGLDDCLAGNELSAEQRAMSKFMRSMRAFKRRLKKDG